MTGTVDAKLNFTGRIEEWFTGVDTKRLASSLENPARAKGNIHLTGTITFDSTTLAFDVEEIIVSGGSCASPAEPCTDGAFRSMTGEVAYAGFDPTIEQGYGGFKGTIRQPQ